MYQDYPVSVWGDDKGLLVVGYPRGSVVRYSVRQDMKGLQGMMTFFPLSFAFTILGAVTVLLISGYRYYRRMRGVTEAIRQLASGGSVHLPAVLRYINEGVQPNGDIHVMGLRIVRQIVKAHGGDIHGEKDGHGIVIRF